MNVARLHELFEYDQKSGQIFYRNSAPRVTKGMRAGWLENTGYRRIRINGKAYLEHVIVWAMFYGEFPAMEIDHVNHIRTDNRIENLRHVSKIDNGRNQKLSNRSTTKICGVYWSKTFKKWQPQIRVDGKLISLGMFNDKIDAVAARKNAEVKYGFHPNHGAD